MPIILTIASASTRIPPDVADYLCTDVHDVQSVNTACEFTQVIIFTEAEAVHNAFVDVSPHSILCVTLTDSDML